IIVARCSSSSPSNPTPTPTPTPTGPAVTTVVTGVQTADGTQATQQTGAAPAASGGAAGSAAAPTTGGAGGADLVTLSAASAFQSVYVSVPNAPGIAPASVDANRFSPFAVANGYWLLRLPSPVTSVVIITSFASTLSAGASIQLGYAVANAAGA